MITPSDLVEHYEGLSPHDRATFRARAGLPDPPTEALERIWLLLLGGLLVLAALAGIAAFVLFAAANDAGAVFAATATTIVGALVGLMAPSPTGTGRER